LGVGALRWPPPGIAGIIQFVTLKFVGPLEEHPGRALRDEASRLLSASYTVRRLLGIHPVEDVPADAKSDAFDASDFETRIERSRRAQRSA